MPPRYPMGEMDEVSRQIGELSAYVHEGRHGVNNLSTKFDALALDIAKRVETLSTRLELRLDLMDARIGILETDKNRRDGAFGLVTWFAHNWPGIVGFMVLIAIILRATGKI